jgi:hypothetical protein
MEISHRELVILNYAGDYNNHMIKTPPHTVSGPKIHAVVQNCIFKAFGSLDKETLTFQNTEQEVCRLVVI